MNLPEARLLGEHAAARGNAFAWWAPWNRAACLGGVWHRWWGFYRGVPMAWPR